MTKGKAARGAQLLEHIKTLEGLPEKIRALHESGNGEDIARIALELCEALLGKYESELLEL